MVSLILANSGCASYLVMQNSKRAIRAKTTTDGVMLGVDLLNLQALNEKPLLQLSAGVLDVFLIYSGYKLLSGDSNSGRNITITGDRNDVTFTGDDNSVDVDNSKESK